MRRIECVVSNASHRMRTRATTNQEELVLALLTVTDDVLSTSEVR